MLFDTQPKHSSLRYFEGNFVCIDCASLFLFCVRESTFRVPKSRSLLCVPVYYFGGARFFVPRYRAKWNSFCQAASLCEIILIFTHSLTSSRPQQQSARSHLALILRAATSDKRPPQPSQHTSDRHTPPPPTPNPHNFHYAWRVEARRAGVRSAPDSRFLAQVYTPLSPLGSFWTAGNIFFHCGANWVNGMDFVNDSRERFRWLRGLEMLWELGHTLSLFFRQIYCDFTFQT